MGITISLPTHPLVYEALVSKYKGNDLSGKIVYLVTIGPEMGGNCEGSEGGQMGPEDVCSPCHPPQVSPRPGLPWISCP